MTILMMAALVAVQPGAAPATISLQPQGKWEVAYNDSSCSLARRFVGDGRSIILEMQPAVSVDGGLIALVVEDDASHGVRRGKGFITVAPGGKAFPVQWASINLPGTHERGVRLFTNQAVWQGLRTADSVAFEAGKELSVRLALGSTRSAFAALAACRTDLLKYWGVDEATMVEPSSDLVGMFQPSTYPFEALRAGQQGAVGVVVSIDRAGKATACRVVISSKSPSLDTRTCSIMLGAHFAPAPDGPEVRKNFSQVRWLLPTS